MEKSSRAEERTGFQERAAYHPSIDLQTDFVMVYGIDDSMPERINEWRERGYVVHLMTGIAWGEYQDYLNGEFDGRKHWDESQVNRSNERIQHGETVPYMVPTVAFTNYLTERIKRAVDAGVEAIHLEEPEFWVDGGYSPAFKREWEIFYQESWQPPHESVDSQYRASKLKAYLYKRSIERLCAALKEYAQVKYGRNIRFYVPTHSLINYTQWRIVSPQSQLLDLPTIDGYIAQIWTGTSRTANVYNGLRKERTFETAYLEYGIMQELARGTKRNMWFLHDPIEDNPNYHWDDYRINYFKTLVASLFHPDVYKYEVSPWPNRIFNRSYPTADGKGKEEIPPDYAANLLVIMNSLRDFKQEYEWIGEVKPIGLFLSDSAMFQRKQGGLKYDGTSKEVLKEKEEQELLDWSEFYGLALPLLKSGIPVRPVQLDNVRRFPSYLDEYDTLIISYELMKPEAPDIHLALSQWVRNGGCLIYVGDHSDEYHQVREWWNTGNGNYQHAAEHLFETLGLDADPEQAVYNVGAGKVGILPVHPKSLVDKNKATILKDFVRQAMEIDTCDWEEKNYLWLNRGPYTIAAVMDESVNEEPLVLEGLFVNLLTHSLPIERRVTVQPGGQALLYNLEQAEAENDIQLIAASSRIDAIHTKKKRAEFVATGPMKVRGIARFKVKERPNRIVKNAETDANLPFTWDEESHTVLLEYENDPSGVEIVIEW